MRAVKVMPGGSSGSLQHEGDPAERAGGDRRVGDYVLLETAGSGGSGVVHRAWQLSLHRFVAIKLVDRNTASDTERVLREARMAAKLSHPHIVPIYEVGQHDGRLYLAMKFIAGQSMDRIRVTPRRAVELVCQAASAIDYAHRNGVIHRDLKPHNLLLENGEHVWVTDFGVARSSAGGSTLTGTGRVVGTPAYMSPEQARGLRCDARSDVYSLGATLYELMTGRHPFEGDTGDVLVMIAQVLSADPVAPRRHNPAIPVDLETIVGKAMAKDPARRYQTARELEDDLRRYLAGEPIKAKPPGAIRRAGKWVRRHPVLSAGLAFALAASVGAWAHTLSLKRQLAETTVAEANALGAAGQWQAAHARYNEAAAAFEALGVPSVAPDLGLLDAHHHAPPPLLALPGHSGTVRKVVFLPDGKQALSVSDDQTMRLWDLPRGRAIRTFVGHEAGVTALALTSDGRVALTAGHDGTLRVWEVGSGTARRVINVRGGAALAAAISPDGRHALSRATDGTVQLWDVDSGRELRSLSIAIKRVTALAFSPDGRLALTGRNIEEKGALINTRASLWEVATGREVQTFGGFVAEQVSLVFSADGLRILTAGYDRVGSVWDVKSGQRLVTLSGHLHGLTGAVFSPRDRIIVTAGQDDTVKLWDADDGALIRSFEAGSSADALAISPDGRFILTGGDDHALKLWDLTVGDEARAFSGHQGSALGLAFSPDSRLVASGGLDRRVRLWDVATGREIRTLAHESPGHAIAFSPDGTTLASGGVGGVIKLWDLATGAELRRLPGHAGTTRSVSFSPDGQRLLSSDDRGGVKLWDLGSGAPIQSWSHGDEVRRAVLSPDGALVLAGSFDGAARFWDVTSGQERGSLRPEPRQQISTVELSPDGRLAATGDERKLIRLWDVASPSHPRALRLLEGHRGDVRALRFSPGGDLLYSASRDRTMRVWDVARGSELHAFSWSSAAIRSFATSPDGRYAMVGNDDGSLNLWDFAYVRQHRTRAAARASAVARLASDPDDAEALRELGEWYAFRGAAAWATELLEAARGAGAAVSALTLARSYWIRGDLGAARRELLRADADGEAPATYLALVLANLGLVDESDRLSRRGARDGRVRFPFLGVRSTSTAAGAGVPPAGSAIGALVTAVFPRSPAQRAGLRVGDVIVRADDQLLIGGEAKLGSFLSSKATGARVTLTFVRDGKSHTTVATLDERPAALWEKSGKQLRDGRSGYSFQTLTPEVATSFGLDPATQGAVVTDTGTHPPSEIANSVFVEDILIKAGNKPLATAEDAVSALAELPLEAWSHLGVIRPGNAR